MASGRYEALIWTLDAGVTVVPVACPKLVPLIEGDDPFGEATVEAVREAAAPLKAGGRRHRRPRLHALPPDPPDPAARVRPRRHARVLRRRDRARGVRDARAEGDRERPAARGHVPLPDDGRPRRVPRDGEPLPAAPDRGRRARRAWPGSRAWLPRERGEARRAAPGRAAPDRRDARTSSSSRTAASSGRRGRRGCSAPRRSRRTSPAGSAGRDAAG